MHINSVHLFGLALLASSTVLADTQIVARESESGWTRIGYVLRPTTSSYIRCELALPEPAKWDGRLWGHGNGGWAGRVLCLRGMDGDHSAHVQCDLGTSKWQKKGIGPVPKEVVDDFIWRATHLMTVEAKRLVREFYGRDAHHAYFAGASTGGRQALFEAYLYPKDYDGIISEVPSFNWLDGSTFAWYVHKLKQQYGWFNFGEQETIRRAELAYFATIDPEWARGRFIVDPRPTPEKLDGCWREIVKANPRLAEREKLWRALFEPVVVKGRRFASGAAIGAEFNGRSSFGSTPCHKPVKLDQVTEETLLDLSKQQLFDRGNPDLGPFCRNGGKMLMYAGYEDACVPTPPISTFYDALARNMGGAGKVQEFFRYFTVPGRTHGALGAAFGKGQIGRAPEIAEKLIAWVERGEVPAELEFTFAARSARLAISPYPESTVRLVPESAAEKRERTEVRTLGAQSGEVLDGVTFNGSPVQTESGSVTLREVRRSAKFGVWEIESCELPVPGEPARVFSLTVRNCGDSPADLVLRLSDASRMAWLNCRFSGEDRAVFDIKAFRPKYRFTFYGG